MHTGCVKFLRIKIVRKFAFQTESSNGSLRSKGAQTVDLHIIVMVVVVRTPHWREGGGALSLCDVCGRNLTVASLSFTVSFLSRRALTLEVGFYDHHCYAQCHPSVLQVGAGRTLVVGFADSHGQLQLG